MSSNGFQVPAEDFENVCRLLELRKSQTTAEHNSSLVLSNGTLTCDES